MRIMCNVYQLFSDDTGHARELEKAVTFSAFRFFLQNGTFAECSEILSSGIGKLSSEISKLRVAPTDLSLLSFCRSLLS